MKVLTQVAWMQADRIKAWKVVIIAVGVGLGLRPIGLGLTSIIIVLT